MFELEQKCRKLVSDNLKTSIDNDTLDILVAAVMGLVLRGEEAALNKLPSILQNIDIYSSTTETVLELAHNRLNNYDEDDVLSKSAAAVIRGFEDNEDGNIIENRSLLIYLKNLDDEFYVLVSKTIHELTHLLRVGGIKNSDDLLIVKDGIATSRYNKKTDVMKKKHKNIEEGIVQKYALEATDMLYAYVENTKMSDDNFLCKFRRTKPVKEDQTYLLQVKLVEKLCEDSHFKELNDRSFTDCSIMPEIAGYYNSVVSDSTAFSTLSRILDQTIEVVSASDIQGTAKGMDDMTKEYSRFLKKKVQVVVKVI